MIITDGCEIITKVIGVESKFNPKALALATCQAKFGANCWDSGAAYIGWDSTTSMGANCTGGSPAYIDHWEQFCYADAYDSWNCNTCQFGARKAAHNPCECGENTATVGYFM
ncbi:MAG TPA: hypothetical protein P5044_06475 [bacterium]|nr:hypothetical protein [bacterium]